jgi:hypothetical protein
MFRVEPALDQVSMSACTTAAFSVAPSTRGKRMFVAFSIDAEGATSTRSLPMCSQLNDQKVQPGQVRSHPLGKPLGGQRRRLRSAISGQ